MAEKLDKSGSKSADDFADDLDSMFNLDDADLPKASLADDSDAIDRLLDENAFSAADEPAFEEDIPAQADVPAGSRIIDDPEYDEFGEDLDDMLDETPPQPSSAAFRAREADDVLEQMVEIDEFSDNTEVTAEDNADFLMADFDITADDRPSAAASSRDAAELALTAEEIVAAAEPESAETEDIVAEFDDSAEEPASFEPDQPQVPQIPAASNLPRAENTPPNPPIAPSVDYAGIIAGLEKQLQELKQKQLHITQDLHLKSDKEELHSCLEDLEKLQSEQRKAKRNIDQLLEKKPVSAYVANGLAVLALIVGGSLGYQGYVAKAQVGQVVEAYQALQAQVVAAPAADAAEKEMLRNQLDELARTNSVNSQQIAELSKLLPAGSGADKPVGELGDQFAKLNDQDMQMGAAIESLQHKIAALEKGKPVTAAAKPAPKKPAPEPENWAVNLIAFKQDWYAKRKAEEYAGKGVPAKVSKTENKGEVWYRLSVDGFNSQYDAAAYAAKIKKTLNLDSVWVAKVKN
ncbi:SPOR domain-containing protein [Methylomonas rhizoryzae]|uniref:SPOR domain-containing protein n=1 Tax=Methylomonas rhizoryzae TaxID=2608981 RepID=UPI00123186B1|nr:SPOR domain-containing protein [Methylomonas rhizoryzae]